VAQYRNDSLSPSFTTSIVDTLRVLSQAQTDVSMVDVEKLVRLYRGPPEGIEFLLSQFTNLGGTPDEHHRHMVATVFRVAVQGLGGDCTQWESLVRKLIQQGVGIHGYVAVGSALRQGWGTLLDDLFISTCTPLEASTVGNSWLRVLASEGFDTSNYLEKEISLHTAQHSSISLKYLGCRRLVFQLGETQSVSWNWHIEPESGAFIVRDIFKSLIFTDDFLDVEIRRFINHPPDIWPWGYHVWYKDLSSVLWSHYSRGRKCSIWDNEYFWETGRLSNLADTRAARRMAKKVWKSRRALRKKYPSQMPGAWPS